MTPRELKRRSIIESVESTQTGRQELAAARLALRTADLLARARRASNLTQRELADLLQVSEGRVSQVLSGETDLKLSTIARYLRAMGYQATIDAVPADPDLPPLVRERRSRRVPMQHTSVYADTVLHNGENANRITIVPVGVHPNAASSGPYSFVGHTDYSSSVLNVASGRINVTRALEEK